jgi:4-diphosphocytidyl-2-C-methyl-D-erythritol kinase
VSAPAARLAAQAKVNLALQVGPRGEDGYHDLATLFARIDFADDVVVRALRSGLTLHLTRNGMPDESLGPPENNLALLAARAYMNAAGWPGGCEIDIEKRIPVGAGLGGGSADAGAVLRVLDSLAPRPLGVDHLTRLAATLGADVPFLTLDAPLALGTGRGDVLELLPPFDARWIALVLPPFSIATADAYAWLDAERGNTANASRLDPVALRTATRDWDALAGVATNDFQSVVTGRYPRVESYREALRDAGADVALLSGSGSAVFGVFEDQPDVAAIARVCNAPVILSRAPARVVAPLRSE